MTKRTYGHTRSGEAIDDTMIERLADEAERGYEPGELLAKPRGRGRPPLGELAKEVESVRLDVQLRGETTRRAAQEGITVSELIRRALRQYLRGRLSSARRGGTTSGTPYDGAARVNDGDRSEWCVSPDDHPVVLGVWHRRAKWRSRPGRI